jgi:tRNA-dihydrouridine synthase B
MAGSFPAIFRCMSRAPDLASPWTLGPLRVPNRVLLAPLAGIGNWFVRLQAKRYGAGMAVSEMVSSHALHFRNERTCREMLRIHPSEREGGPVSIQLFGQDPAVMRSAAALVAEAGADAIDLNMGCPVPKVCRTGAGAALLSNPSLAVAVARAAVEGAEAGASRVGAPKGGAPRVGAPRVGGGRVGGIPITVKLRSGLRPGDTSGFELAHRLVEEAGVAAIAFHPRSASVHHKGVPNYELAERLAASLPVPVILTGGLRDAEAVRSAFARTGVTAVMLARGCLGNPWLFERLLGDRAAEPTREEVLAELDWVLERAVEHLGAERATRYLRKFYPWYLPRLGLDRETLESLQDALHTAPTLERSRVLLGLSPPAASLAA